jgi:hypothetical protein
MIENIGLCPKELGGDKRSSLFRRSINDEEEHAYGHRYLGCHRIPVNDVIRRTKPKPEFSIRRFRRIGSVNDVPTRNYREIRPDRSRTGPARIGGSDDESSDGDGAVALPAHADDGIAGPGQVAQEVWEKRTVGLLADWSCNKFLNRDF